MGASLRLDKTSYKIVNQKNDLPIEELSLSAPDSVSFKSEAAAPSLA